MYLVNCSKKVFKTLHRVLFRKADKATLQKRSGRGAIFVISLVVLIIIGGLFAYFKLSPTNKNVEDLLLSKNMPLDKVTEIAEKQVERNPNDINKRIELSDCYTLTNNFGKAEEQFQKVLQSDPNNEYAKDMLKLIRYIRGED